jgi:phosphoglycerate dehydrogenase-like enzyme
LETAFLIRNTASFSEEGTAHAYLFLHSDERNSMSRILFTQPVDPLLIQSLQTALGTDSDVGMVSNLDNTEFAQSAHDAEVLINFSRPLTEELLHFAPHVGFVQQISAGYDHLDLPALAHRNILTANLPGGNADAVAEHTLLLMLCLLKKYTQAEQSARANTWETMRLMQSGIGDLGAATVGLIGFGAIGRAVAQRLRGFGTPVLYTTPHRLDVAEENQLDIQYASLPDLLATSTIVSLHLPLNEHTYHLIDAEQLALMRRDALIINTARGGLVDEQALLSAIQQQKIAGAGLDVLEYEKAGGNIFTDLPQVIVTPHIGGVSRQAAQRMMGMALGNVARFLQGKQPHYLLF